MRRLRRTALRLARSRVGGIAAWLVARWLPAALPGRVHTEANLVVLRHPVPTERTHLLVVPRRRIADAHDLRADAERFWDALDDWLPGRATDLGVRFGVTNVGSRQDVPLLHVHLIDRCPPWAAEPHEPVASAHRLADAIRDGVTRGGLRRRSVVGGSYGFAIPPDGASCTVWAQSAESTS